MTIKEAVSGYSRILMNTDSPVREARLLVSYVTGMDMAEVIAKEDTVLTPKWEEELKNAALRRSADEPFAYITGEKEFMGLKFKVNKNVLIPRPDTEMLVNIACGKEKSVIDLCTGSGCVAVSLAKNMPWAKVTAADFSDEALAVAKENAALNGTKVEFINKDIMKGRLKFGKKFELAVANPPYIKSGEIPFLSGEVRGYEPHEALDGGKDGLDFYKKIVADAELFLKTGGRLCFEIGSTQSADVKKIMSAKFENINIIKDYAGYDRVVVGELSDFSAGKKHEHSGHRSRLRKRYIDEGLDGFQLHEVLELLLFYAVPRRDVNTLAHKLINEFGSISAVLGASVDDLMKYGKLTESAAVLLNLIPHLSRIYSKDKWGEKPVLKDRTTVGRFAVDLFRGANYEQFYVICLDSANSLISCEKISEGTINETAVYPRLVIQSVIKCNANKVYLAHNHPSGSLMPSWSDTEITDKIEVALGSIDVELADHIIVGGNEYAFLSDARRPMP